MSKHNGNGAHALKLDPHNARKHPDRNKAQIAASLKELGAGRSILVDATNTIIAGNGVYEQAQALGYKVKVIEADGKTLIAVKRPDLKGAKARRMALADNRATETSEWDVDVLADLAANDAEALAGLFDERELRDLLGDKMPGGKEETADAGELVDKAAELQAKWQVKRGDVWQAGKHRVMCGDSTNAADVARLMGGERAQAVVTDSPYGIERDGIANDNPEGLRKLFDGCLAAMPIENAVIINFQSPRLFPVWLDAIRSAGHKFERALWFYDETDVTHPWRGWLMTSQIALVSSYGKAQWASGVNHHDCYIVKTAGKQDDSGGHTTAKPLDVVTDLVAHTAGVVYDPFLGSGTTLVACEQTGRIGRGMEIEPKYVAVSLERLSLMGLEAKRIDDGNGKTKATA